MRCAAPTRTSQSWTATTITRSSRCSTRSAPATSGRKKSAPRCGRSSAGRPTCACDRESVPRLDYPAHALVLQGGARLDLDYLIVAAGAEANFFGIPDLREHGWPLYTLPDTISLRRHLLSTLEQAAVRHDAGPINVVVAGAAPPASRQPERSPRWPVNWASRPPDFRSPSWRPPGSADGRGSTNNGTV